MFWNVFVPDSNDIRILVIFVSLQIGVKCWGCRVNVDYMELVSWWNDEFEKGYGHACF